MSGLATNTVAAGRGSRIPWPRSTSNWIVLDSDSGMEAGRVSASGAIAGCADDDARFGAAAGRGRRVCGRTGRGAGSWADDASAGDSPGLVEVFDVAGDSIAASL